MLTGGECDVFFSAFPRVGDGHSESRLVEFERPQLLAGFGFQSAHILVERAGHEEETTRSGGWSSSRAGCAGFESGRKTGHGAVGYLPGNVPGIYVDRGKA